MFKTPSQEKLKKGVDFILQQQKTFGASNGSPSTQMYVPCKAGRTWSATLVTCYLMQVYAMSPAEVVLHMIVCGRTCGSGSSSRTVPFSSTISGYWRREEDGTPTSVV